jgi:hypothetical protein
MVLKKKLTPFTLRGCNFLNSNMFLMIFSASNVSIRGFQVLFGHLKVLFAFLLDLACPERLSGRSCAVVP